MATRAVSVVVEKSPGGLNGWWIRVGSFGRWLAGTPIEAMETARLQMMVEGIAAPERRRVLGLLIRELDRKRCATVTAEVARG